MYMTRCEINKLTQFIIIEWCGAMVKGLVYFHGGEGFKSLYLHVPTGQFKVG